MILLTLEIEKRRETRKKEEKRNIQSVRHKAPKRIKGI
jgi:hypothetical protein